MEARMGLPGPRSLLGHRVTQFQVTPALTHVAHTAPKAQPFPGLIHPISVLSCGKMQVLTYGYAERETAGL